MSENNEYYTYRKVNEVTLRRVKRYPRTSDGFVILPDYSAYTYKDFRSSQCKPIRLEALFPLISTREDVLKAYPAAPPSPEAWAEMQEQSKLQTHKRSRVEDNSNKQTTALETRNTSTNKALTTTAEVKSANKNQVIQYGEGNAISNQNSNDTKTRNINTHEKYNENKNKIVEPVMHFADHFNRTDYLGRSFLTPPTSLLQLYDKEEHARMVNRSNNAKSTMNNKQHEHEFHRSTRDFDSMTQTSVEGVIKPCTPPRTLRGVFKLPHNFHGSANNDDNNKNDKVQEVGGIQQLHWAPPQYGHLLFSADLHGNVQLWDALTTRQLIANFTGHATPIKSLCVTSNAEIMSTGSVDGRVVMWDVNEGRCMYTLTNPEKLPVVQHLHHPLDESHLLLAALDNKIVLYDVRVSCNSVQREYTGHMGTIFNLNLLSNGNKLLTTSEDRTLRTWDFRIPVQIKQFADANMHAITHVLAHPHEPMLAAQSLDNKIIVFQDDGGGKLKLIRGRQFSSHTISGTRCQLAFSRDGRFVSSGDIHGKVYIWDWSTGNVIKSFKAHSQMLVSHLWHPLEPSRMVTSSWDGTIKNWV